jgi:hypothetical protein
LALVPLAVGLLFGGLALPRSVPPREIPEPIIDGLALSATEAEDEARAARVVTTGLSSRLRAVGSAFRAFNEAEARKADEATLGGAGDSLVRAVRAVTDAEVEGLLDLRAYQVHGFLKEVHHYEQTGEQSEELLQLGGTFVERMEKAGWCARHKVLLSEDARRTAFKATWNHLLGLDASPRFALALDEQRALYAFYLRHPHPPESERARVDAVVQRMHDDASRTHAQETVERATATWLLAKIGELAKIDKTYPVDLARGAVFFLRRDYRASASMYQGWLERNPTGAWTLRVQNYLRASLLAADGTGK